MVLMALSDTLGVALFKLATYSKSLLCVAVFACTFVTLQFFARPEEGSEDRLLLSSRRRSRLAKMPTSSSSKSSSSKGKTSTLPNEAIEMLASRKWKSVLAWIVFYPHELKLLDKRRQTALHLAVLFRAPAQVIEMILFQAPELAHARNEDGEIALHWSVRLSAPKEILGLLLTANPSSGFFAKDKDKNTPFSLLWDRHQEDLLDAWWQGRETLLSLPAWRQMIFFFLSYHCNTIVSEEEADDDDDDDDADSTATSSYNYDNNNNNNLITHTTFRPLHIAAKCACPPAFFPMIMSVYSDQCGDKDERAGRVPLAIAASDPVANRSTDVQTKIQLLLHEYPPAALMEDADGRLPLLVALSSGITWLEGVSDLVAQTPEAVSLRDPVTKLFPFMLAAYGAGNRPRIMMNSDDEGSCDNNNSDSENEEAKSISTIYRLLRSDPLPIVRSRPHVAIN